ncbi:30S ribosomal protein S2 [Patescibacteria group bacterium]|nr:30S ribosomal protein S2 [Patescibacteria group bacterium]MBU1931606.1 30S ribosomal protein S2 [Patescibacteria group bacterium]
MAKKKTAGKVKKDNFKVPLTELLEAGCHFGHQVRRGNPKMKPYIYAQRDKVHIFDLAITAQKLSEACEYVKELVAKGGKVCFVGTKRQARSIIKEEAIKIGAPYVYERWLGGTITNWQQIKKSIKALVEMKEKKEQGEYKTYTKKENVLINRKITRLERFVGGLTQLTDLPEAIFVVDISRELTAVREAKIKGVSVIALVDTNSDPDFVDYVIPANDDAVRSIKLVVAKIAEAVELGNKLRGEKS